MFCFMYRLSPGYAKGVRINAFADADVDLSFGEPRLVDHATREPVIVSVEARSGAIPTALQSRRITMSSSFRILLFYDGTAESRSALIRCAELAVPLAALVDVVTVVDYVDTVATSAGMFSDVTAIQMEEQAQCALKDAIDELGLKGVVASGHVAFGQVADAISRIIELLGSDLIVVGHRTRSWLARWFSNQPIHIDLAERLKGSMIVTVTPD